MNRWLVASVMLVLVAAVAPTRARAALRTEVVEYTHGETVLEGYLAYDDALEGKRPGVIVVHEWKGLGPYAKRRAEEVAGLGYIAFAIDMYGKGVRAQDHQEASKLAAVYKSDRPLMRARAQAGLDVLARHPLVDPDRLAAIGYCFGGTTVLELARSGAALEGVVSFHGSLETPDANDAKRIKAKILVLNGANDPLTPADDIAAFQKEMRAAGVDWQFVNYGGAVHSFTNPESGTDPSRGAAYNPVADRRSWQAMQAFLKEVFE